MPRAELASPLGAGRSTEKPGAVSRARRSRPYGRVMLLLLTSDTAPLRANALPSSVALELKLMLVSARMFPFITLPVPSVAELPTCQYTFFAWAPPIRTTDPATVSAEPA